MGVRGAIYRVIAKFSIVTITVLVVKFYICISETTDDEQFTKLLEKVAGQ